MSTKRHALIIALLSTTSLTAAASQESPVPAGWLAEAHSVIARAEYQVHLLDDGTAVAPNRAHAYRTAFSTDGIRIRPEPGGADAWRVHLRLTGFGRAGALWEPDAVRPTVKRFRVEYRRAGLTEWYINDPRGLEQGFEVDHPPTGPREGPLVFEMSLGGARTSRRDLNGSSIAILGSGNDEILRYSGLLAYDSNGRKLDSSLAPTPDGLQIRVDDRDATYPIIVDPWVENPDWEYSGSQECFQYGCGSLGSAVASAGDVNGDGYDDVIIGAPFYDGPIGREGMVFVFLGTALGLDTVPGWTASGGDSGAQFGQSVASAGDVNGDGYDDIIIGSPGFGVGFEQGEEGFAYVWLGGDPSVPGNGPTGLGPAGTHANADWYAQSNQENNFGGCPPPALICLPGGWLGSSVSSAGDFNGDGYDDVLVGCPGCQNNSNDHQEGRAFLWLGAPTGLGPNGHPGNADWSAQGNFDSAFLGYSVSGAGDLNADGYDDVIIGGPGWAQDFLPTQTGFAFVWYGQDSGLPTNVSPDFADLWLQGAIAVLFGFSVAGAGDVNDDGYDDVIVGAPQFDSAKGKAFVYLGPVFGLGTTPYWTAVGDLAGDQFGYAVASVGDFDGDGGDDIIVGAPYADSTFVDEGRVALYVCKPSNATCTFGWDAFGGQAPGGGPQIGALLGHSVAGAGDVNQDGFGDVVVGASGFDLNPPESFDEGRAYLYLGRAPQGGGGGPHDPPVYR